MSKQRQHHPVDPVRRTILGVAISGAVLIPLAGLFAARPALAAEKLSEDDPQAKALEYVNDASTSKNPKRKEDQFCKNCNLVQRDSGEWRPCAIFRDKLVNENGWCTAWVKKA